MCGREGRTKRGRQGLGKERERAVVEEEEGAGRVLGFWVRSAPRSSEEGCSVRRMWNSRSAHSVTPAAAYPSSVHTPCDAIRTTLRFSLPSLSLSFLLSSAPLSLSALPVIRFLLTDRIALRYATTIAWNVVRDWRSFSRFLGGLELYIREEEEEERFYTDDKTKEEVGCLLVSLVRECR